MKQESKFSFDRGEVILMTVILLSVSVIIFGLGVLVGKGLWQPQTYYGAGEVAPTPDAPAVAIDGLDELPAPGAEVAKKEGEEKVEDSNNSEKSEPKRDDSVEPQPPKTPELPDDSEVVSLPPQRNEQVGEDVGKPPFVATKDREAGERVEEAPAQQNENAALTRKPKAGKYTIQVRAFKTLEGANLALENLSKQVPGEEIFVVPQRIPSKGLWYRVLIGEFDSSLQAKEVALSLKGKPGIDQFMIRKADH